MHIESKRINLAFAFGAAAAAWPETLCAVVDATSTPLQRAFPTALCGGSQSLEFLGHCPACWSGAAAFLLAAAFTLALPIPRRLRAALPAPVD